MQCLSHRGTLGLFHPAWKINLECWEAALIVEIIFSLLVSIITNELIYSFFSFFKKREISEMIVGSKIDTFAGQNGYVCYASS